MAYRTLVTHYPSSRPGTKPVVHWAEECPYCHGHGTLTANVNALPDHDEPLFLRIIKCPKCKGEGAFLVPYVPSDYTEAELHDALDIGKADHYISEPHGVVGKEYAVQVHVGGTDTYIVTRTTCTCGEAKCHHRGYAVAMNDMEGVDIRKHRTEAGRIPSPVLHARYISRTM